MSFTGKCVLVAEAGSGLGLEAARLFCAAGAQVAAHVRSSDGAEAVLRQLAGGRSVAAVGDLTTVAGCRAVVESAVSSLGGLDCLVVNSAAIPLARPMEVTEERWDAAMDTVLRSAMFLVKFALPALRASKGTIVMVSAAAAMMAGPTDRFMVSVTKSGLLGMARNLAIELAPAGIRVNSVAPGFIDTPELRAENAVTSGQIDRFVAAAVPAARIGASRECATAILFLASDEAAYCSGTVLGVDGGSLANASWGSR